MIYLDAKSQKLLLERIEEALHPEGVLFMGHSESYLVSKFGFVSAGASQAFAFRKRGAQRLPRLVQEKRGASFLPQLKGIAPVAISKVSKLPEVTEALDEERLLSECEGLANAGELARSAENLSAYLKDHQFSVRAHFLMGIVRDAEGKREEASSHYRKVLYLDPGHQEALMHLRFYARHRGDLRGEKILSKRLERLLLEPSEEGSDGLTGKNKRDHASRLNFIRNSA